VKLPQPGERGRHVETPQLLGGKHAYAIVTDEEVGGFAAGTGDDKVVEPEATQSHTEAAT